MIKVGCCGYPTSMKKYYEVFCLVELNSTFYQYPKFSTVENWRNKAPTDFEFTVKAHQDISHNAKLKMEELTLKAFEQMKEICKTLKARILLIQTPGSFGPDKLSDAKQFFTKINRENMILAWETRGEAWENLKVKEQLQGILKELDVTHVVDPFKIMPAHTSSVAYFRLHGLGKQMYYYQYTNEEFERLFALVEPFEADGKEVYVLFNNLSMFGDGVRFMQFIRTGKFLSVTGAVGLESVKTLLQKTRYPVGKSSIVKRLGWKLIELEDGKQFRLGELLEKISSRIYKDADDVLKEVKKHSGFQQN